MINNQVKNVEWLKESRLKPGFCLPDSFDKIRLQTELLRKDPGNDAGLSVFNGMNYDSTGGMEHQLMISIFVTTFSAASLLLAYTR